MRRRGVLVTSSKKRPRSPEKKEKNDLEEKLASQREWEELERLTNASRARQAALEGLQTNRLAQVYDDVASSDDETRINGKPIRVKEERGDDNDTGDDRQGGKHQDSTQRKAKGDDLDFFLEKKPAKDGVRRTAKDDDLDFFLEKKPEKDSDRKIAKDDDDRPKLDESDAAAVSEAKRRRLCNAPKNAATDGNNNADRPKKMRGGRKKKKEKPDGEKPIAKKETAEKSAAQLRKAARRKRDGDDKESDRFRILEVEGYKKPRKLDTTRLVKYTDFDAPSALPSEGNFRSQITRSSI